MTRIFKLILVALMALGAAVGVAPSGNASAFSGCGTAWYSYHNQRAETWCADLVQGEPGTLGEWVRVWVICNNDGVRVYGPKVYNDNQHSVLSYPCYAGAFITSVGATSGTG